MQQAIQTGERGFYGYALFFWLNSHSIRANIRNWRKNALWLWQNRSADSSYEKYARAYARAIRVAVETAAINGIKIR